ncbi:hypothetical protein [Sphingomonas oligophenolica]|uniref:Uncharacterized protein n=1 Tax=Sphingomonas oligophenolica TaxID=301154 RepID=A0A502CKY6_9SPHN|nr:hypothetical protein [Sphingomonas oligophenolica]TPG12351.1 hypothetical protein EAH84_09285 [Sphingomonas oligophenolica]
MTKANDAAKALRNPKELAAFLHSPKDYIAHKGIDVNDENTARSFEQYARTLIENVNAANRSVGLSDIEAADWGIGAGCCNSKVMLASR